MQTISRLMMAAVLSATVTPAVGASPPATAPLPVEHRLSDAEIEKVLDDAAAKREAGEETDESTGRKVHGEVGFTIGTGGYRSVFGTAVVPVLKNGVAILSFEKSDFGRQGPYWGYPR